MTQAESLGDILDFWHKVEFFIPFDLKQVFDQASEKDLKWLSPNDLLAQSPSPWQVPLADDRELTGFTLYLGIFEMALIEDFARELPAKDAADPIDEAERTSLEGRSCIARISLDAHGESTFDRLSVSTAPWAMGMTRRQGLASLTSEAFESAQRALADRLFNFRAERLARLVAADDGQPEPLPLTGPEIMALHALLTDWCGYALPSSTPVALLEIQTRDKKDARQAALADDGKPSADSDNDAATQAEDAEEAPVVDILNSFFIEDIEQCMASMRAGEVPATIRAYLEPAPEDERVDLYQEAGHAAIIRALHPERTNIAHWPETSSYNMSLMQQFAINTAFERLASQGLYSVNGPPGTGKTTLLREMICENVARRAQVLAGLPEASAGLAKSGTQVRFANEARPATIRTLAPELTGFEMVVASMNNAAVENISTDLPKRKRLGKGWSDVQYLQPVAHKVAAQVGEKQIAKLAPRDVPWSMLSCALGNSKNRRRFVQRFFFDARAPGKRGGATDPCTIWDWRNHYAGPTFAKAQHAFLEAERALRSAVGERLAYAELQATSANLSEAQFVHQAAQAVADGERDAGEALSRHEAGAAALKQAEATLADLREEERLLDRAKPGLLAKLFGSAQAREHADAVARNARAQIEARKQATSRRGEAETAAAALRQAQAHAARAAVAAEEAHATWQARQAQQAEAAERFAGLALPGEPGLIETDAVQTNGYWQDDELSSLRTRVFVAALALHEAWLAEVLKSKAFGGNLFAISKLLGGARLENPDEARLIWQSLFMVVPVVSTTFASFARQFRGMGAGSIGWLFIDEAGQAVPQAAVGALWRARRAMVVGDPLQIEPVFTVPTRLINALADLSPHTADGRCSPASVSVQRLADDANPFGTRVAVDGADPLWIGSPLRVHRRCVDPMFSVANRIAYQDKMVFGLDSRTPLDDPLHLGDSAWVHVEGKTSERQVVPAQIDAVEKMVVRLYAQTGKLPPLYVISPFKAVKHAIQKRLLSVDWRAATDAAPAKKTWQRWCDERIGTVHTFQGKEESVVIFVLGADHDGAASAGWAASKPNLLNVALTRAQHRIFIVGDASLWGDLKYFGEARARLGTPITPEQWLGRIEATGRDAQAAKPCLAP